jgi:hypothetical protein
MGPDCSYSSPKLAVSSQNALERLQRQRLVELAVIGAGARRHRMARLG